MYNVQKHDKEYIMKPLKSLQKQYPDIERAVTNNGTVLTKKYVATKRPTDVDWTVELANRIPHALENKVKSIGLNFNRSDLGNDRDETIALASIIPCRVEGVLESAKHIVDDKVYFEDVVVCKPAKADLAGLTIYVPQHIAGYFQPGDIKSIVGEFCPVKITDLKQVVFGKKIDVSKPTYEQDLSNEYVALGDICIAEYLKNNQVLNELNTSTERSSIRDVQSGMVNHISNSGVFLLTSNLERVFIHHRNYSYKNRSKVLKPKDYVKIGDQVDFKYTKARYETVNDTQKALGLTGNVPVLTGERLSLEEKPEEVIKYIIDSGRGTVVSGYIIGFDAVKGHTFEVDGGYGLPLRLAGDARLTEKMAKSKQKLSATLISGRYEYRTADNGDRYLRVHSKCVFNSAYSTFDGEDFFN